MGRVINTATPAKKRNQARRTIAEILQRLAKKSEMDDDAKDMLASIVINLEEINETITQAILAWEKRDYWVKAERYRQDWVWLDDTIERLIKMLVNESWENMMEILVGLIPRFGDVSVNKLTRKPEIWFGTYHLLIQRENAETPD